MTAVIYVSTLTSAVILFHERLNALRIVGVLVIGIGVIMLAADTKSPKSTPD